MKYTFITVAAMASCLALNAAAQSPPSPPLPAPTAPAGPAKIAVIGFQEAVAGTNDFQRRFADLQKKYEPKRQQTQDAERSDHFAAERTAGPVCNPERCRPRHQGQAPRRQAEGTEARRRRRADRLSSRICSRPLPPLPAKSPRASMPTRKNTGSALVLDGGNQQLPVVIYANPSVDITKAVIEAYNVKSGIPAPETTAAGAPGSQGLRPLPPGLPPLPSQPAAH